MADRSVRISRERLRPFVGNFHQRHGELRAALEAGAVVIVAGDGARATIRSPWGAVPAPAGPLDTDAAVAALEAQAAAERLVGVLLARRTAHAVAVARGSRILVSKVDTHYVQGRTKKGGWSQQRYARRRGNQARAALADASDDCVERLLPRVGELERVVTGGEQTAVDAVLADPRLTALAPLAAPRAIPTVDPRQAVLEEFVAVTMHELTVTLNELA